MQRIVVAVVLVVGACHPTPGPELADPALGASFATVERTTRSESIRLLGALALAPGAESVVATPLAGRLVDHQEIGAMVDAGDIVATIDLPAAPGAKSPPPKPERDPQAQRELDRLTKLARLGLVGWARVAEARRALPAPAPPAPAAAPVASRRRPLRATRSGVIVELGAARGAELEARQVVATLVEPARLEVRSSVPELYSDRTRTGLRAHVSFTARPELDPLTARISRVAARAELRDRQLDIALALDAPADGLRPGLGCVIRVELAAHTALRVPESALVRRDGRTLVAVRMTGTPGSIDVRTVEARPLGEGFVELLSGVSEGEQIAVRGAGLLIAPPVASAAGDGAQIWLVTPPGRAAAIAGQLPPGALQLPPPLPTLVELDSQALSDAGVAPAEALARLANDGDLPPGWGSARRGTRFAARRYERGGIVAGEAVDALVLSDPSTAGSLRSRALELDPAATVTGLALPDTSPILLIAGAFLAVVGTGSLRAAALLAGGAFAIGRQLDPGVTAATPAHAVAATLLSLLVIAALERSIDADASAPSALAGALGRALLLALPAAAACVAVSATPARTAGLLAAAATAALAAGALLLAILTRVPTSGAFDRAPIERLPTLLLVALPLLAGGVALALLPPQVTVSSYRLAGAPLLEPELLAGAVERSAHVALASGAVRVLAAAGTDGEPRLVVESPWPARTERALRNAAPRGLGLSPSLRGVGPAPELEVIEGVGADALDPDAARLAGLLAWGPTRIGGDLVRLRDPSAAALLPIPTRTGSLLFRGEVHAPPRAGDDGLANYRAGDDVVIGESRPAAPAELRFAAAASAVLLLAAVAAPLERRWRGASPRIAWRDARGPALRSACAGTAAAAAAAAGLPSATTAALLAIVLGAAVAAAIAASYVPVPTRPSARNHRLPATSG